MSPLNGKAKIFLYILGIGISMRVPRQLPPRKIFPWLGLGYGLGLVLRLGTIFLGGNCPRKLDDQVFRKTCFKTFQVFFRPLHP